MKHVTVTTAVPLTAELRKEVQAVVERKFELTAQDYELKEVVQAEVLGGVSITVDSKQYDATVRGKLNRLSSQA